MLEWLSSCRAVTWLLLLLVLSTLCTAHGQADPVPRHTRGRRHLKIPRLSKHSPQDDLGKPQPQQAAEVSSITQADQEEEEKEPERPKRERVFGAT